MTFRHIGFFSHFFKNRYHRIDQQDNSLFYRDIKRINRITSFILTPLRHLHLSYDILNLKT